MSITFLSALVERQRIETRIGRLVLPPIFYFVYMQPEVLSDMKDEEKTIACECDLVFALINRSLDFVNELAT